MTISKPSPDSHNPLKEELLEALVGFLEGIGGVDLIISDEMVMSDLEYAAERWAGFEGDFVKLVPSRSKRMVLLQQAKRVVLWRYFQQFVELIAERRMEIEDLDEDERSNLSEVETLEWELANWLPEFVGRPSGFRRDHAWLISPDNRFFGQPLSPHYVKYWTKQLLSAAGLSNEAIVYFVSLDDPSKVKIGWTGNLPRKLSFFRNGTPSEPTVHLTLAGGYELEQELHRRFKADWIVREWFHLSPAILTFIEERKQRTE